MEIIRSIQNRIYEVRAERIILDRDLAVLYDVPTKALNLAVRRNIKRFPKDFMFQLNQVELEMLRFEMERLQAGLGCSTLRFQIETSNKRGGSRYLPYAFTEQGIAMLSGILNSDKAIKMNIAIMRAFVETRRLLLDQTILKDQLTELRKRIGQHDVQLSHIYDTIENLIDETAAQRKWENRDRIGFITK
jgi:hypothetical protein